MLIGYRVDLNYISEGIVLTQYFYETTQVLNTANEGRIPIKYKLSNMVVCNKGIFLEIAFLLSKELSRMVILGRSFLCILYPFKVTDEGIMNNIKGYDICFSFSKAPNCLKIDDLKTNANEKEFFLYSLKEEAGHKVLKEKHYGRKYAGANHIS